MDDNDVRRHVAVLEDRLDRISEAQTHLSDAQAYVMDTLDRVLQLVELLFDAMNARPRRVSSDASEGKMH